MMLQIDPKLARSRRSTIGHARQGLTGCRALVASIIGQATVDYLSGNPTQYASAVAYFRSDWYRHHLAWLGLPGHFLPEDVTV